QLLAGLEAGDAARRDLDRLAGLRVAAGARRRVADAEGAEAAQVDLLALRQAFGDQLEHVVDDGLRLGLRYVRLGRNSVDQIRLLHGFSPPKGRRKAGQRAAS